MKTVCMTRVALLVMLLASAATVARAEEDERAVNYVFQSIDKFVDHDYDGAIADCTKAIEIDPQYAAAYANRAMSEHEKHDYDAAIADDTRAIELNPQDSVNYGARAFTESAKGDDVSAIADWKKEIELDPSHTSTTQPFIDQAQARLNQR